MMYKQSYLSAALIVCNAMIASAQQAPAVRALSPAIATSSDGWGQSIVVREVASGVLVNDLQNRRLMILDANLANPRVVADTTSATANAYSGRIASLIAYHGDSSLFVDPASMSMLVIDGSGNVARVMSIPRPQDAMTIGSAVFGTPAFDAGGRLVYRSAPRIELRRPPTQSANGTPIFTPPDIPDSTAIVRIDLRTRSVDTVGFVKVPKVKVDVQRDENGRVSVSSVVNPLPIVDEWAVLSDGSIALVRGRDYHIDWLRPNGTRESTPKIPFDWQRLSDDDKVVFIDSVKAARTRLIAAAPSPGPTAPPADGGVRRADSSRAGPRARTAGAGDMVMIFGGDADARPRGAGAGFAREVNFVLASELPDYKPPFFAGAARADRDGHLWIRTIPTKTLAGGPVYDVINNRGDLVDRVQLPKDRTIVGFGAGGVAYLAARDGDATKIEKAKAR